MAKNSIPLRHLNVIGGGSKVKNEKSPINLNIGNATKIVVKFSNVAHSFAEVKISSSNGSTQYLYYESGKKFDAFTKNILMEKSESQTGYYYIKDINGKRDITNWVKVSIYISTASGCPWLNYYKGKVEVYAE